jgi:hypothetical protein
MLLKKLLFCGKGDNSNLNIGISKIQLAMRRIFKISQSETRVAYGGHVC